MKKSAILILTFAFCFFIFRSGFCFFDTKNSEAEKALAKYVVLIKQYKLQTGIYPNDLKAFDVSREAYFVFFKPIPIEYSHESEATLWFNQLPLGPKHVYKLETREWEFSE